MGRYPSYLETPKYQKPRKKLCGVKLPREQYEGVERVETVTVPLRAGVSEYVAGSSPGWERLPAFASVSSASVVYLSRLLGYTVHSSGLFLSMDYAPVEMQSVCYLVKPDYGPRLGQFDQTGPALLIDGDVFRFLHSWSPGANSSLRLTLVGCFRRHKWALLKLMGKDLARARERWLALHPWWCTWCGAKVSPPDSKNLIVCGECGTVGVPDRECR